MISSVDLSRLIAALVAVVLSALGINGPAPAPHVVPQLPVADSPVPGTVIKRDGAEITVRRVNRPHNTSVTAQIPPASGVVAPAPGGSRLDMDGDGKDDIVIGAYLSPGGGYSVIVDYSSLPYRDFLGPLVQSPTRPNFGDVLTSGDFNGDGHADLAISNQGEFVPGGTGPESAFAGAVWIFYGGPTGLSLGLPQHITQNLGGVPDDMEGYDMFGAALAAGDINGDGYDEIAIGAPGESTDAISPWVGSTTVLFGSETGLTATGAVAITQDSPVIPDDAEPYDSFGRGLAIGDMTGDGYADLAVGSPGESNSPTCLCEQGMVVVIPGTASGLASSGVTMLHGSTDVLPIATVGESLVMADFDQDGFDDLIAASPRSAGGGISFMPGTATGLTPVGVRVITEDTPGVPSEAQCCQVEGNGEAFGFAVATGEVTGDAYPDVLVTNIDQDIAGAVEAGSVIVIPGSAQGLTGAGSVMITQFAGALVTAKPLAGQAYRDVAEAYDYFGTSASIANLDGVGPAELLVGTDREVNSGEPAFGGSGFLMALRYQSSAPRRGSTGAPPGLLVPVMSWPGTAFASGGLGVYFMGSSLLHS